MARLPTCCCVVLLSGPSSCSVCCLIGCSACAFPAVGRADWRSSELMPSFPAAVSCCASAWHCSLLSVRHQCMLHAILGCSRLQYFFLCLPRRKKCKAEEYEEAQRKEARYQVSMRPKPWVGRMQPFIPPNRQCQGPDQKGKSLCSTQDNRDASCKCNAFCQCLKQPPSSAVRIHFPPAQRSPAPPRSATESFSTPPE